MACSTTPSLIPANPPRTGLCLFPQACYHTTCDCNAGPEDCRVLPTTDAGAVASGVTGDPMPADPATACEAADEVCQFPEDVCIGRGVACVGFCVRAGGSCDGSSDPFLPQRRQGDGGGTGQTFCPYVSDVCCPGPDGGAVPVDAGVSDASVSLPGG